MMKHYLMIDNDSGEEFIVGEYNLQKAMSVAAEYFNEPEFLCMLSDAEAECSGLDEY